MKRVLQGILSTAVCTLLMLSGAGCQKAKPASSENPDGNYGNNPRQPVPDELVGYWLTGTSSITNFWDYNGTYGGNALELAVGYMFHKNGTARQYFYYTKTSTYCRDQVLGYREGTVVFDGGNQTFRFYAASGNYRRFDRCGNATSPGYGETKIYGPSDLYPGYKAEYNNWTITQKNDGTPVWRIKMTDGSFLDYEKSAQPQ